MIYNIVALTVPLLIASIAGAAVLHMARKARRKS